MSRECKEYEITVENLLKIIHRNTERIKIKVIASYEGTKDGVREFFLTENFSKSQEEIDRILKYYANVPVWNLHTEIDNKYLFCESQKGNFVVVSIVANCYYKDIRDGYLLEKSDIRKAKAKEYRKIKKTLKKG